MLDHDPISVTVENTTECEIVTSHVALELGDANDTVEHLVTTCGGPAVAVVDDDGDDVTVCWDHLPIDATIVQRLKED